MTTEQPPWKHAGDARKPKSELAVTMALHGISPCWRCGDLAHWASETDPASGKPTCPYAYRAGSLAEHERRLQFYIDRWQENKISTEYKRQLIEEEYALWRPKRATERKAS